MSLNMANLVVSIVRFVDEAFPGWVEGEFADAAGGRHTIIDKVPIFTSELLEKNSLYPRSGSISCEILTQWAGDDGCESVRIITPGIESTDGYSEFVVRSEQLSAADSRP
jgi:hypothetical protein